MPSRPLILWLAETIHIADYTQFLPISQYCNETHGNMHMILNIIENLLLIVISIVKKPPDIVLLP
jgi:hypothetical protein